MLASEWKRSVYCNCRVFNKTLQATLLNCKHKTQKQDGVEELFYLKDDKASEWGTPLSCSQCVGLG